MFKIRLKAFESPLGTQSYRTAPEKLAHQFFRAVDITTLTVENLRPCLTFIINPTVPLTEADDWPHDRVRSLRR